MAVLAFASVAAAQPQYDTDKTPYTSDRKTLAHHTHRAKALIDTAYSHDRWRDPTPVRTSEKRRWQAHRRAILHPPARFAISEYRDAKRRSFERHREARLEVERLTPYDCGSHGSFAIPCYVVACESGYNWGAVNSSSGARGPYQILPSTYAGVCERCDWSRPDQHLAASRVWARSGGSEWVCA